METETGDKAPSFFTKLAFTIGQVCDLAIQRYQQILDKSTPYVAGRWIFTLFCLVAFIIRVFTLQGWYIVTYGLGIYLLNLFIAFLTPRFDPALAQLEEEDDDERELPTKTDDEFRPFVRRLPEFKFWKSAQWSVIIAFTATFFKAFDVPVFWPILVLYFIILFVLSMKKQIGHMIKHRYIPFSLGKPRHKGKEDHGAVVRQ